MAGLMSGTYVTLRLWRHLVTKRFRWMTNEEVEEFLRRDPGF